MNEFLLLWLGFDSMFTVAAKHRHRKIRFIHLFVNLSSTKRTQNEYSRNLTYPNHQYNCIKSLTTRYEEVFWTG